MAQGRSRPAWAEIDLAAVAHNAAVLAQLVAPAELCAVVKAHGYGHGGPAVARAALAGGAQPAGGGAGRRGRRAAPARRRGAGAPAERVRPRRRRRPRWPTGSRPRSTPPRASRAFAAAARAPADGTAVHVKVDTGMHRVGGGARGPAGARRGASGASRCCELEGVWTHLPVADGEARRGPAPTPRGSSDLFDRLVADLAADGRPRAACCTRPTRRAPSPSPGRATTWCAAGSASTATCPGDAVRAAFDAQAGGDALRPAMSLKARVVAVRTLDAGERPSYGRLRPLPGALRGGHGAHRLRRRRAARPVRRRLRGPDRRAAPAAGRAW